MVAGGSVMRMRERGLGDDFDIFWRGSERDIMRLAGAKPSLSNEFFDFWI
jgi:hypothetical protein